MIINHEFRFIFLKTKKTAGTSIEIGLSKYCSPRDVLTRIGKRDEPIRTGLGYQGPANYLVPKDRYTRADRLRHYLLRKEICYWNHMPGLEVRERIGHATWNSYYKFCVERNPWDRLVSAYFWENRSKKTKYDPATPQLPNFDRFLRKMQRDDLISNAGTYVIDDQVAVDRVMRYENLAQELEELVARLGLPGPIELPNAKSQYRKDRRNYRELYGEQERDYVASCCAREISLFGYQF